MVQPTRSENEYHTLGANAPLASQGWLGLAFVPNNNHELIYSSSAGQLQRWDASSQRLESIGAEGFVRAPYKAVSPDGKRIAVLTNARQITIVNLETTQIEFALNAERSQIYAIDWSGDSENLAVGLSDGGVMLWRVGSIRSELKIGHFSD